MNLTEFLDTPWGEILATMAFSMLPVVELRGGIPFGVLLGLHPVTAFFASLIGNMIPTPFIIIYIRRLFQWTRRRFPRLEYFVDRLEQKAHLKGQTVLKYQNLGLYLFVAVPLPGTGGWTGSLIAAFLDIRLRNALPSIFLGLITAGLIVLFLTMFAGAAISTAIPVS